eukprot:90965_1
MATYKQTLNKTINEFIWNYSKNKCDLMVNGFCKINYINRYFNSTLYSFPNPIIALLIQFVFAHFDLNKLKKYPKRICKEIQRFTKAQTPGIHRFTKAQTPGIHIFIHPNNYRYFLVKITGPADTPYEGGTFWIEMFLTNYYPIKPPKARMITKIHHPDVDKLGRICLDILKDRWTPALTVSRVCLSIQLLIKDPNPVDPLDSKWRWEDKPDIEQTHKLAREWTVKYAM